MSDQSSTEKPRDRFSHYYKACPYTHVDVYRVLQLFEVADPCLQHAIKKLLCAGGRGAKDAEKDIAEAIVSLNRWQEMRAEEKTQPPAATVLAEIPLPCSVCGTRTINRCDTCMFQGLPGVVCSLEACRTRHRESCRSPDNARSRRTITPSSECG